MDTATVRGIAQRLRAQANHLEGNITGVQRAVDDAISHWDGDDAHSFNSWWTTHYRPAIVTVQQRLVGLASSLENNATEQEKVSGAGHLGTAGHGAAPVHHAVPKAPAPDARDAVTGARDWHDVQKAYDAWATGRFAAGGESYYQCTAWANYRWHELGYSGPAISGNGGAMAGNAGATTHTPSLHAMGSYGTGVAPDYGHVMIVEEIRAADGAIRVSEMNADGRDLEGHPWEYRDQHWIPRSPDGSYYGYGGRPIRFAPIPR
jgi:surface antigen/uncharacterized protein YukE